MTEDEQNLMMDMGRAIYQSARRGNLADLLAYMDIWDEVFLGTRGERFDFSRSRKRKAFRRKKGTPGAEHRAS